LYQRDLALNWPSQSDNVASGVAPGVDTTDPRYAAARDAAIRSFLNRYGRMPTEGDIDQMVAQFLSPEARAALGIGAPGMAGRLASPEAGSMIGQPDPVGATSTQELPRDYAEAAERVVQSFRNRYGRPPTEDEFRQSIGHFLPGGAMATANAGASAASPRAADAELNSGMPGVDAWDAGRDTVGTTGQVSEQISDAVPSLPKLPTPDFAKPAYARLEPRGVDANSSEQELEVILGKGRYAGWMSLTNEDDSWSGAVIRAIKGARIDVSFKRRIETADAVRISNFRVVREVARGGSYYMPWDDAGTVQGPGRFVLTATNEGPFRVGVAIGAKLI
jgi:hypothetical protein